MSSLAVVVFFILKSDHRDRFCGRGYEGKYSNDIRLFSSEFQIAEKRLDNRNFKWNIRPILNAHTHMYVHEFTDSSVPSFSSLPLSSMRSFTSAMPSPVSLFSCLSTGSPSAVVTSVLTSLSPADADISLVTADGCMWQRSLHQNCNQLQHMNMNRIIWKISVSTIIVTGVITNITDNYIINITDCYITG